MGMWNYSDNIKSDQRFDRCQDFFNLYENQKGLVASVADSEFAITVKGDFSWGFPWPEEKKEVEAEDLSKKIINKVASLCRKKSTEVGVQEVKEEKPVEVNRKFESYIQLRDINLKIKKGEFVCIIGDTSSGKTTLLRTLSGETAFVSQEIIKKYT